MVDLLALGVTHLAMALAVWRLVSRADLDDDPALPRKQPQSAKRNAEPRA